MIPPGMLDLPPVSSTLDGAIRRALDAKTKPPGSLGEVEALAARIARIQGTLAPRLRRCRLTLLAGDHGVAAEGVSAYPQAVTQQMVANFLAGGAAANVFARANGVDLSVVDAGVAGAPLAAPGLLSRRIAPGTRNFALEPAMTREQYEASLRAGAELGAGGGAAKDEGAAFGEMGIANTSSATLIAHKLTGAPLDALTGRGAGLDDDGLAHKRRVLARAAARTAGRLDAHDALTEYGGGFEIAMMAGAMIGAARAGAVVLVDGFIASTAALAADRMAPALREYLVFAHRSAEPGHRVVLDALGASPLLDLGLRLGEGTGTLLAWPIPPSRRRDALRHGELRKRGRERSRRVSRAREELAALALAVKLLTRWPLRSAAAEGAAGSAAEARPVAAILWYHLRRGADRRVRGRGVLGRAPRLSGDPGRRARHRRIAARHRRAPRGRIRGRLRRARRRRDPGARGSRSCATAASAPLARPGSG